MDRERLGRVLGRGARLAARTAFEAVDAATSAPPAQPDRRTPTVAVQPATSPRPTSQTAKTNRATAPTVMTLEAVPLVRAAKAAGKGFASPLRRASSALWLELTGCFFALFALSFGLGVWHTRVEALSPLPAERHRFAAFCLLTLLFAYFSVSSFVRAKRVSGVR